ncbi:cupredoxin family copper-binding protein [Mycobacteroides salmoniphilum]|uniref:cupredoxin domain-containing protein n=1 Tax=Mycobacteroides salmoniphilum TaxID=404941 RepID=UPI0009930269|nr:cupredoxin family copper-binding protein [Mycobacteroides salmoniphilum]QCH26190.1 Amicyanin-alpha precursor [Mycobacteroides salmoniphilum]
MQMSRLCCAVLVAAAAIPLAACSGSGRTTSDAPLSITIASDATSAPGMSGHSMPGMTSMPTTGAAPSSPAPAGPAVNIENFAFNPPTLTVPAGTTVTWTNKDEEPHNVVAEDGTFRSPGMDAQGTFSYQFATPGTYQYVCGIHPFMKATVVVR